MKVICKNNNIGTKGTIQAWISDDITNEIIQIHENKIGSYDKNLTPDVFLTDLTDSLTGTSNNFEVKYIALSTAYDPPTKTSPLELELARVAPTGAILKINKKIIIEATFGNTVTTQIKNISSVTSTTIFVVNDVTGLAVGDRIGVKVAGNSNFEERKIIDITGATITVHLAFSGLPVVGTNNCKQMISRLHLVYGSSATSALNSGKALSLAQLKTTKLSTQTLYTRHEIEVLST